MFESKEIEAFRTISAPADLRERILSSCKEERMPARNAFRMIRTVSTFAACLILVICFSVMTLGAFSETDIMVSGEKLTQDSPYTLSSGIVPASYDTRTLSSLVEVPLAIFVKGNAEIIASDGLLGILNEAGEISTSVSAGTAWKTSSKTTLVWSISADTEKENFELTIRRLFNTEIISLTYDKTTGEWTVAKNK